MENWFRADAARRTKSIIVFVVCLLLGLGVGLAYATIAAHGAPAPARRVETSMECPPDMQGCTTASPRWHQRKFRQHVLRPAPRHIHYRPGLRHHILVVLHRKWNRHHRYALQQDDKSSYFYGPWPGNRRIWHKIIRHDTCAQNSYPANTVNHCRHQPPTDADYARLEKALFCGAGIVLAIGGGAPVWVVAGGGLLCGWSFASKNL